MSTILSVQFIFVYAIMSYIQVVTYSTYRIKYTRLWRLTLSHKLIIYHHNQNLNNTYKQSLKD